MYAGRWILDQLLFNKMSSISETLMPLLPSRYNTKTGFIFEAEINASLETDNWADLSWKPPTLKRYLLSLCKPFNDTVMGGRLYGTHLWQASKIDRKWVAREG